MAFSRAWITPQGTFIANNESIVYASLPLYLLTVALGEVSGKSRSKLFNNKRVNEKSGTKEEDSWTKTQRPRGEM